MTRLNTEPDHVGKLFIYLFIILKKKKSEWLINDDHTRSIKKRKFTDVLKLHNIDFIWT